MIAMNNFLNTVTEDYYTIWTGNIPTKMLPEKDYDKEQWKMIEELKTMISNNDDALNIEMQILDICTYAERKGYNAGFKMALSLAGLDNSEEEEEKQC